MDSYIKIWIIALFALIILGLGIFTGLWTELKMTITELNTNYLATFPREVLLPILLVILWLIVYAFRNIF